MKIRAEELADISAVGISLIYPNAQRKKNNAENREQPLKIEIC